MQSNFGEGSKNFLLVPKSKIAENGDYNLSGDRYRVATDYSKAKWEMVELGEVCEVFNGSTPKRTESQYWENGTIPWFTIDDIRKSGRIISSTQQKITQKGYKESSVKLLPQNTVLLCCTASVGEYAYSEIELTTNQQFNGLVVKKDFIEKLNPKFLYWCSSTFKDELDRMSGKATFGFVSVGTLKKFKIPLPPLEIQEQIVSELDGYSSIIAGAKQIVANWKPKIDTDPSWEMVELGNSKYFTIESGGTPDSKNEEYWNGDINWATLADLPADNHITEINSTKQKITESGLKNSSAKLLPAHSILVSSRATIGRIATNSVELATNQGFKNIVIKDRGKVNYNYVSLALINKVDEMIGMANGGTFAEISKSSFSKIKIPLPPLETQQQIVSQIEAERTLVESAKKLIEIYEQKTKAVIKKLWEE